LGALKNPKSSIFSHGSKGGSFHDTLMAADIKRDRLRKFDEAKLQARKSPLMQAWQNKINKMQKWSLFKPKPIPKEQPKKLES
jgi:hypothetical protein